MSHPDSIAERLQCVRERIAAAAKRAGRDAAEIKLVGVTKYVDAEAARALVEAGCSDLGESRPQSLWEKSEVLRDLPIQWHFIGHLQRNKVRRTMPQVSLLHSGDSLRLLEEVNACAQDLNQRVETLLEVNISGDATKHGFSPEDIPPALSRIAELSQLNIRGLMTMAALEGGPERARQDFAHLRQLRDDLKRGCPSAISLAELSMGMSGDFEEAIEEGATIIRVGSALWEDA